MASAGTTAQLPSRLLDPLRELGRDIKVQQELLRHAPLNIYTQAITAQKREANSKVISMLVAWKEKGARH
jgi:hypothetical protein